VIAQDRIYVSILRDLAYFPASILINALNSKPHKHLKCIY